MVKGRLGVREHEYGFSPRRNSMHYRNDAFKPKGLTFIIMKFRKIRTTSLPIGRIVSGTYIVSVVFFIVGELDNAIGSLQQIAHSYSAV
jgi:hypothetical protein